MTVAAAALRQEVEAAVLAEIARIGPSGLVKADVVRRFLACGASQATLYRWIDAILASGRPAAHAAAKVKAAAADRAARASAPATEAAHEVGAMLPATVCLRDIAGEGGTIAVIEKLKDVIADFEAVAKFAKTADGKVRNPRMLMLAGRELRQCLETAVRLKEAIRQDADLDAFNRALVAEIGKADPATAERVLTAVGQFMNLRGF